MRHTLISVIAVASLLTFTACGGKKGMGPTTSTIQGVVRAESPSLLLEADGGKLYILYEYGVGAELRSLVGMRVALSGPVVSVLEDIPVLQVVWYELLPLSTGERPVVGWIQQGGFIRTEGDVVYKLEGDFEDVLLTFVGSKVWVVGVIQQRMNTAAGAWRVMAVTDYGVIIR